MDKKTIKDIEVAGKVVLCRVDFNVPRNKETGEITNDNRVVAALPTINYLLEQAPKCVVLFSHLGKVKTEEDKAKNDLAVVAPCLEKHLGKPVTFVNATDRIISPYDCQRKHRINTKIKKQEGSQPCHQGC